MYFQNGTAKQYSLKPKILSQSPYLEGVQDWRLGRKFVITSSSQVMIVNKNSNQSQERQPGCLYNERRSTEEIQRNKTFSLRAKHKTRNE